MTYAIATILTLLAALWRFLDGRGIPPKTTVRNAVGLAIALGCAYVGMGLTWQAGVCALLAWATLVLGRTKWESWAWSIPRYGLPAAAIGFVAYLGGSDVAPCIIYATGGLFVAAAYVIQHRYLIWPYSTVLSEILSGAVIIGGIAYI